MIITYWTKNGMTLVELPGGAVGLSRTRRDKQVQDKYQRDLGVAIAAMKAKPIEHLPAQEQSVIRTEFDWVRYTNANITILNSNALTPLMESAWAYTHATHVNRIGETGFDPLKESAPPYYYGKPCTPDGVVAESIGRCLLKKWRVQGNDISY
jgi:hypothetical protein